MRDHDRAREGSHGDVQLYPTVGQPGRRTLTAGLIPWRGETPAAVEVGEAPPAAIWDDLGGGPVQRRAAGAPSSLGPEAQQIVRVAAGARGDAQSIAERGFGGGGGSLPHLDRIQAAFGPHDVSDVRAHVGGAAAEAARDLGAVAYASGGRVAFEREPDLFVAAHEAAHVVQQRGGVQLAGGVGQVGDEYEQHADAVADAVVRGEPATALLDRYARGGAVGGASVQRMPAAEARLMLQSVGDLDEPERRRQVHGWSVAYTRDLLASISEGDREDFAAEIEMIEQIRSTPSGGVAAQEPGPETAQPGAEARQPEGRPPPQARGSAAWESFAQAFDAHFPDDVVRHFRADAQLAEMDDEGRRTPGQPLSAITGVTMEAHFTANQRALMTAFFEDLHLPERLFNTGEAGPSGLSVVQRRLMSAHMLTVGTYERTELEQERQQARSNQSGAGEAPAEPAEPAAEPAQSEPAAEAEDEAPQPAGPRQRIRARMCMHWVQLVNAYAGAGDATRDGVMGNYDHDDNLVLNSDQDSERVISETTPRAQRGNDKGTPFTKAEIDQIQPGDWLYIAMPTTHSVMFSQFIDETWQRGGGVEYRTVVMYDQGSNRNEEGGQRHVRRIGPVPSPRVKTVLRREGGSADAHPAQTPEDVVPHTDEVPRELRRAHGDSVEAANREFMERRHIAEETAFARVTAANRAMIERLAQARNRHGESRLAPSQRAVLEATNAEPRLESVVRLHERLEILVEGADAPGDRRPPPANQYETSQQAGVSQEEFNPGTTPTTGLLERIWSGLPADVGRPAEQPCE